MSKNANKPETPAEAVVETPKPAADPRALKRASALSKLRKAAAAMAEAGEDKAAEAILALIAKVTK